MRYFVATFLALTVFIGGCAARSPIDPEQLIPVEIRPTTSAVTVSHARVIRQDGKVLVSGSLHRPSSVRLPGHVDVLFFGADGSMIAEKKIEISGLQSRPQGSHEAPFSTEFDLKLPAGARAVLSYHAPPF